MSEENIKSLFNEAALKMVRLDRCQSRISDANLNPLNYNNLIGKYGYEIIITELNNLVGEVWGKLSNSKKKKISDIRAMVLDILEVRPVHEKLSNNTIGGHTETKVINYDNWIRLREILFQYHMEINVLLEETGYSAPSEDALGDLLE